MNNHHIVTNIDSTTISGQNFYIDNSTDSANRVNLGTGQFPSGTVVDYDHTKSILAGTYADELQFVNGAYRTPADSLSPYTVSSMLALYTCIVL